MTDVNITINEEFTKPISDSPALTEATSYTSSPEPSPAEDESKHNSIRRNLFKESESPKDTIDSPGNISVRSNGLVIRDAEQTLRGSETGLVDTTSTTSSETTAVPSWNLSAKDANGSNTEEEFNLSQPIPLMTPPPYFPLDKTLPILSSSSSFGSDENQLSNENQSHVLGNRTNLPDKSENKENIDVKNKDKSKHKVVVEEPPEAPASCNAVLNMAEIVMAFGQSARQRYQGSDQTDNCETASLHEGVESNKEIPLIGSPAPVMTSRNLSDSRGQSEGKLGSTRSTQLERNAANTNKKRNAFAIIKLQQAMEAQKQLNSLKEVEIMDKQAEIQLMTKQIRKLQKEKEDHLERETELRATINILKKELDKMTLLNSAPSDELQHLELDSELSSNRAENFRKEAELAESRAKEQQARIEELEKSLEEKEKENFDLRTKIDLLHDQQKEESGNNENESPVTKNNANESTGTKNLDKDDASANDEIESRLKEIMKRLEAIEIVKQEREKELAKRLQESYEEDENILGQDGVEINVMEDPDEIEAMTMKKKPVNDLDPAAESAWCCTWS